MTIISLLGDNVLHFVLAVKPFCVTICRVEKQSKKKTNGDAKKRKNESAKNSARSGKVNRRLIGVLSQIFLGIFFFVALAFAFYYAQASKSTQALWWGIASAIFAIVGIGLYIQQNLISTKPETTERPEDTTIAANIALNRPLAANEVVELTLTLLNGGPGPAKNVQGETGFVYKYNSAQPDRRLCATGTTFGPVTILPRAQIPVVIRGNTPLPVNELKAIEEGKEWLFFCGTASYEGIDKPIDFCWVYRRQVKRFTDCSDLRNPYNVEQREQPKPDKPTTPPQRDLGSGSGAPPYTERSRYPRFKWTDYTEDYFYDAIWRWSYRPQMGSEPRNVQGSCPECERPLEPLRGVAEAPGGLRYAVFVCRAHPLRQYSVLGFDNDPYDGIRTLIREKLENGKWETVVKKQYDARRGIV